MNNPIVDDWENGPHAHPCLAPWRVLRGGSWNNNPQNLRSANRNRNNPTNRNNNNGFRIASTLNGGIFLFTDGKRDQELRPGPVTMTKCVWDTRMVGAPPSCDFPMIGRRPLYP